MFTSNTIIDRNLQVQQGTSRPNWIFEAWGLKCLVATGLHHQNISVLETISKTLDHEVVTKHAGPNITQNAGLHAEIL